MLMPTMMHEVMRSHTVFQSSIFAGNLRSVGYLSDATITKRQQIAETIENATCASLTVLDSAGRPSAVTLSHCVAWQTLYSLPTAEKVGGGEGEGHGGAAGTSGGKAIPPAESECVKEGENQGALWMTSLSLTGPVRRSAPQAR